MEPQPKFDAEAHELALSERYARLASYAAFDRMIDMALDGVVEMSDAIKAYCSEEGLEVPSVSPA